MYSSYIQNNNTEYNDFESLEAGLLKNINENVYVDHDGLNELFSSIHSQYNTMHMDVPTKENIDDTSFKEIKKLQADKEKYNKAMERWDNVYLFSDDNISEREYLQKKNQIAQMINNVQNKINQLLKDCKQEKAMLFDNKQLDTCIINYNLGKGEFIDYKSFAAELDEKHLKEFFNLILDYIVVKDKKIIEVVFKNGLRQKFFYKDR